MSWSYTPYIIPSIIAIGVSLVVISYIWRRRDARGAKSSILLLAASAWWSFCYLFELGSPELFAKLVWARLEYVGIVSIPVLWLFAVSQFIGKTIRLRTQLLLAIIPIITLSFVWTNDQHGLIWRSTTVETFDLLVALQVSYGPWFWVHTAYSYSVVLSGLGLVAVFLVQTTTHLYRLQMITVLVAATTPFIVSILYITDNNPFPNLDLTPFSFTITGIAVSWAIFRFRLLDLMPIAHNAVIDSMSDGVIVTDSHRRIVYLNPTARTWVSTYGLSALVGQPVPAIFEQGLDWSDSKEENIQMTLRQEVTSHFFDLKLIPLHGPGAYSIGHLLVFHDITAQILNEKQLQQYQNELEALVEVKTSELTRSISQLHTEMAERSRTEAHLQHLLRASPAVIYAATIQGTYSLTYVSDNVQKILGYQATDFTKDDQFWLNHIHPDDRARVSNALVNLQEAGSQLCEYRFRRPAGNYGWIQDEMRVVQDERDSIEHDGVEIVGYWVDITELHEARSRLQQQERLAAVGQLSAGIAHDFNNILTSIMGFADLMSRQPDRSEADQQKLGQITRQSQKAAHLVSQILDFSRESALHKRCFDLTDFLYETVDLLERTILTDIRFVVEVEAGPHMVEADVIQLQQVLTNLALNARDAMPNGGILRFHLTRFHLPPTETPPCLDMPPGEYAFLAVQDTGLGISESVLPYVLEPFFTTKDVGQGSGLGLSQVYGIIKQHHGFMHVDSEEGQGTTFSLYIPLLS